MDQNKSSIPDWNEREFFQQVRENFEEKVPNFNQTLNIAIIGEVSTGKTSLINALLGRSRENMIPKTEVGEEAGVTKEILPLKLDDHVTLVDSPGLNDVRKENSKITKDFLKHIDVGIFLITEASKETQKKNLDDLRNHSDHVFVVLNRIDQWDRNPKGREKVIEQLKQNLNIQEVYPVCTFGYDKDLEPDVPLDIRGVDTLREDIETFLKTTGKDLLIARHMADKKPKAVAIIATATVAAAGEAWLPGSAAYITATQAGAIASLYYLYTGKIIGVDSILATMPTFVGKSVGQNIFLWVEAFIPPTGILDVAAASIAATITLAMLVTVNSALVKEGHLNNEKHMGSEFAVFYKYAKAVLEEFSPEDFKNPEAWSRVIYKVMKSTEQ